MNYGNGLYPENTAYASKSEGEEMFSMPTVSLNGETALLSPKIFLLGSISRLLKNSVAALKNWRVIITVLVLAALWVALPLLQAKGTGGIWLNILMFLTFADGNLGKGVLAVAGSIIGKGVYSLFIFNLVLPLSKGGNYFRGIGASFNKMFSSFRGANALNLMFFGVGMALIMYNFLAGTADLKNCVVGIAAFFVSLKALSNSNGFLRGLLGSLFSKYAKNNTAVHMIDRFIAGWVAGFALTVVLSALNIPTICYMVGALVLVVGLIITIIIKIGRKQVKAE